MTYFHYDLFPKKSLRSIVFDQSTIEILKFIFFLTLCYFYRRILYTFVYLQFRHEGSKQPGTRETLAGYQPRKSCLLQIFRTPRETHSRESR